MNSSFDNLLDELEIMVKSPEKMVKSPIQNTSDTTSSEEDVRMKSPIKIPGIEKLTKTSNTPQGSHIKSIKTPNPKKADKSEIRREIDTLKEELKILTDDPSSSPQTQSDTSAPPIIQPFPQPAPDQRKITGNPKNTEKSKMKKQIEMLKEEMQHLTQTGSQSSHPAAARQTKSDAPDTSGILGNQQPTPTLPGTNEAPAAATKKPPAQKKQRTEPPYLNHGPAMTSVLLTCKEFKRSNKEEMEQKFKIKCGPEQIALQQGTKEDLFIIKKVKTEHLDTTIKKMSQLVFKGSPVKAKVYVSKYPFKIPEITKYSDAWKK